MWLGAVVSGIWGFVEGIMILCGSISVDGYGNPLVENNSPIVVNQYNGNVINNVGNYNNDFKVKINEKKEDGNNTIILGDVVSGSISVDENARIEDMQ